MKFTFSQIYFHVFHIYLFSSFFYFSLFLPMTIKDKDTNARKETECSQLQTTLLTQLNPKNSSEQTVYKH